MPENDIQNLKEEQEDSPEEMVPMELVEFISSEKTSSQIADICLQNGVSENGKIEEVSYRIALVLLGNLPKESLVITLKEGMGLDIQTAEKISAQADKLIFSQMPQAQPQPETPAETEVPEEPKKPLTKDTYREPLE